LAIALLTALLAACSSLPSLPSLNPMDWFSGSSAGPKPAELPTLANSLGVRVMWSSSIGAAAEFVLSPALFGDHLYAASRSGTVMSLDPVSGQVRWRITVGTPVSGGVGTDGTLVAVATDEGEVIALDAQNGQVRWRARVSSEVLAAPKVG